MPNLRLKETEEMKGFPERKCTFNQGASRVAPGKSGVYACDEEEPINALESW